MARKPGRKISIIIPALNEEKQIADVIREVRNRGTAAAISDIIVVDGGSTDRTVEAAEQAGATVITPGTRGRAAQMNSGADAAGGDLYYFLHADTVPPHGFTAEILQAVKKGAQSGSFQLRFTGNHPLLRFYSWCTRFRTTLVRFGDQSLFVDADLFHRIGGFNERLSVMEDQEIVRRLKKNGRFQLLAGSVITSSRKYELNGTVRLQLVFTMILILYYFGVQQDTLVHLYKSLIRG